MTLTEHEARISKLEDALEGVTEFTLYDNEGHPVVARRRTIPHWEFTRPDGGCARVAVLNPEQAFKLAKSIARYGIWPSRMEKMPEFEELPADTTP